MKWSLCDQKDHGISGRIDSLTARSPDTPSPAEVLAVHRALALAGIPHAVGGAIALARYGEPRPTSDIDINVFVSPARRPEVEAALAQLERRDVVHLFFSDDALHGAMPAAVRRVPFDGATIPLVSPEHLIVRKALLDRSKDWLDIEAILIATYPLDLEEILTWIRHLTGPEDPRATKLCETTRRVAN